MVVAVDLVDLIEPGASGNVDFAADDGLDARFFGRFVKLHTAVHDTVVGAGDGRLPALLHAVHQLVDAAGTSSRLYSVWIWRWTKSRPR